MFIVLQIFDEPDTDKHTKQAKSIVSFLLKYTYYAFELFTIYESARMVLIDLYYLPTVIYFLIVYYLFFKSFILAAIRKSKTKENVNEEQQNFCQRCNINREYTTHHCKICQSCILQMDHHCFFVGNCIGKNNYKYFISFICYTILLCVSVLVYIWPQFHALIKFDFNSITVPWLRLIYLEFIASLLLLTTIFMAIGQVYVLANNTSMVHMKKYPKSVKYSYLGNCIETSKIPGIKEVNIIFYIEMILEYALNEEDDYKRMINITRGCQQLAQQLPFYSNFTNSHLMRQLFCCYPFQQEPVQLLLSIMMDRYQNVEFLNCLYQGLCEISQMQEQKTLLSSRSPGRGRKSFQKLQNGQAFAKDVIENLVISKQYAVTFLKPLFLLVQQLKQSLESRVGIFMSFVFNTRDEYVIKSAYDAFQECKNDIFGTCTWVNRIEDQFDQFFYQHQIVRSQSTIQLEGEIDDDEKSSESSIEVDPNEEIQKWICQQETPLVNERLDYFRSFEYLELIFRYIFDPPHFTVLHEWEHHFGHVQLVHDQTCRKIDQNKEIDTLQLIRSLKTLKIIIHEENYPIISKLVPQFLLKLFHYIYDSLNDFDRNVDLNQMALLVDFLLQTNPRQSIYMIVDLNLMFQFASLAYNEQFVIIIEKIITDEYGMGNYVHEHLWEYLECTDWISYFISMSLKMQVDTFKANKNYKSDKSVNIVGLLKQQINFDLLVHEEGINLDEKRVLTDYLGQMQAGKNYIQFYGMNQLNWHLNQDVKEYINVSEFLNKDIDNLKLFISQRTQYQQKVQISIKEKQFISQIVKVDTRFMRINSRKKVRDTLQVKDMTNKQIAQKVRQLPRLTIANQDLSRWIQISQGQVSLGQSPKSPSLFPVKTEPSDDFSSSFYEGFSSSRLKVLYPSYKNSIQSSSFERKARKYVSDLSILPQCISILKGILQNIFVNMLTITHTDKKQQQRAKIEQDTILPIFVKKDLLNQLFRIYLYEITNSEKEIADVSQQCGIMINEIYYNCYLHSELHIYKQVLKECFYEVADYICKVIVKLHDNDQQIKFKRYILVRTLEQGFILFGEHQETPKNVFTLLNETVLHLLIIWFFDSEQSNIYQLTFVKLFTIIFARAPQYLIGNILFKLGFVSSLQNAYFNFYINGIKYAIGVESLFYHVGLLIYSLRRALHFRKLTQVLSNLELLGSWEKLKSVEIDTYQKIIESLDGIIMESDGLMAKQILKKKTTLSLHNKNVMQTRKSQIQMLNSHKFSMQQTATNVLNVMKVKERLMLKEKRSINY